MKFWQFSNVQMAIFPKWPKILAIFFWSSSCLLFFGTVWRWSDASYRKYQKWTKRRSRVELQNFCQFWGHFRSLRQKSNLRKKFMSTTILKFLWSNLFGSYLLPKKCRFEWVLRKRSAHFLTVGNFSKKNLRIFFVAPIVFA